MQRTLAALALVFVCAASAAAGFDFSATPGPYPVGLRVTQQYDYSRVFKTRIDLLKVLGADGSSTPARGTP